MQVAVTSHPDLGEILRTDDDIECECMLCHLPLGENHGPVEWRLTWTWQAPTRGQARSPCYVRSLLPRLERPS
jgi:hypothetical protein